MALKYFNLGTGPDTKKEEDNPLSASFVPPAKRTRNSAARWWALVSSKRKTRAFAETSFEKVLDTKP